MESKSRRTGAQAENRVIDILVDEGEDFEKPPQPKHCGAGEYVFLLLQVGVIILYACTTEYGEGVHAMDPYEVTDGSGFDPNRDVVQNLYPFFQDVHVMIFIGFGFLMTFIKTSSWSALSFNWIGSVWCLEWAILTTKFWAQVMHGGELHRISISIENLIAGDFGAGAGMITFGAILGKCNLQQLFFLFFWEMVFYGLNEAICVDVFHVSDAGGSILVHTFGAYFGLGACFFFQPARASKSANCLTSYQSEMIAVVGSVFLWMFWPSFNGALASGATQHRIVCNTVLGIGGSCIGAAATARIFFGKLDMELMLNATLAGGVAIGSSADLVVKPYAAILIGLAGGIISSFGFAKLGPFMMTSKLNLQDTCGVQSLHGIPGVFAAITSMLYLCSLSACEEGDVDEAGRRLSDDGAEVAAECVQALPTGYLPAGSAGEQAVAQLLSLLVTLAIAIFAGLSGGFICSMKFFKPPHALFRDDDHFHGVLGKYPSSYMENTDEAFHYGQQALRAIQKCLVAMVPADCEDKNKFIVENIWEQHARPEQLEFNRHDCLQFFNDFLRQHKPEEEDHDYIDFLEDGAVFAQIYKMLDANANGKVSQSEVADYLVKLVDSQSKGANKQEIEFAVVKGKKVEDNSEEVKLN